MRLITYDSDDKIYVTGDLADDEVKPYAILSHTWGQDEEEVKFHEIGSLHSQKKLGYTKIEFCGKQARQDGLQHFWVDTCCIDKRNSVELSEAITSMYRWYQQAQVCYVYLTDVSSQQTPAGLDWQSSLRQSRWFTRGWTLQELLAPRNVVFYSKEWHRLGTKHELMDCIHDITGISILALEGQALSKFPIIERMRWTRGRQTKKKEDEAYCLLGIFGVFMYLSYGEGDNAFQRLQKELDAQSHGEVTKLAHDYNFRGPVGSCLGMAPCLRSNYFVGRDDELKEIRRILLSDDSVDGQRQLVLGGMGGIGKTQLALAFAQRHTQKYDSILWLNATSEATLIASFQGIAKRIFSAPAYQAIDSQHLSNYVHSWLSHPRNTRWLLIFDNYDEPQTYNICSFYPDTAHGTIVITSRRPDLVTGDRIIIRPLQDYDAGLQILQTRSERGNLNTDASAYRLAQRLAGLPLALATAGAFLQKSVWTFQQYFDAYEQQWDIIAQTSLSTDYQGRTLYTTWQLSYERLVKEQPHAAGLLKLLAYFDHQALWYDLLHAGTRDNLPDWLLHIAKDPVRFESTIHILVDYCFVETQITTRTYSIRTCIHDWIAANLNRTVEPWSYWYAFNCVGASIPTEDWGLLRHIKYTGLTPHAVRLVDAKFDVFAREIPEDSMQQAKFIAYLLRFQAQRAAAEQIFLRILARKEKALGADHLSTLTAVHHLAMIYSDQAKLAEAEQMYNRALTGYEKALGADHISTLKIVNNLGTLYQYQGKPTEAEQIYDRALTGYEKAGIVDDIDTLHTVHNLSTIYHNQGKLAEAERMYDRALAGREKTLGADHFLTLKTVHSLGALYQDQGKLIEAEQMYDRALAGREKVLRTDHLDTLSTVQQLGTLYQDQGKLIEAEQMYDRALAGREKTLGADHLLTLKTVENLGSIYHSQDKLMEAEQMYHRALAGYRKAHGANHKSTLDMASSLGYFYWAREKLVQAEQLLQHVATGRQKTLGSDHPATKRVFKNLQKLHKKMKHAAIK